MTPLPDKAEKSRNLTVDRPDDDSGDHGWRFFPTMPLRVVPPPPPPRRAWNVAGVFFGRRSPNGGTEADEEASRGEARRVRELSSLLMLVEQ